MEISYRDLLNETNSNEIVVLTKPFVTDEVKSNYTVHKEVKIYDEESKDFKSTKIATLDGFNFICKSPKDFSHEGVNYKSGDDVFLNCKNNEYKIVDLKKFDINKDFEYLDYFNFKDEEKDIESAKKLGVDFFAANLDVEYKKKLIKLKEDSSLKIGAIKIGQ